MTEWTVADHGNAMAFAPGKHAVLDGSFLQVVKHLVRSQAYRISARRGPPASNQVLYHLKERAIEHGVLPWCESHGVAVVGYSPFGHGDFPAPGSAGGRVLESIANAHQATPRQVALRFLLRRPSLFTIPRLQEWRTRRKTRAPEIFR